MRDINKQILSGFVNTDPKIIQDKNGRTNGVIVWIDAKSARDSDKYEQWSAMFWNLPSEVLQKNFIDMIKKKRITVIGKAVRNCVKKIDSGGKEYYQYYSQIRVSDFCLGSVDLWRNPHIGEVFKFREQNVDIKSLVDNMIKEDDQDDDIGDDKDGNS